MYTIKFRYNKYSQNILYIMIIFGIAIGLLIHWIILDFLGINSQNGQIIQYFQKNSKIAIYMIFGLIPICMLVPVFIAFKLWGLKDEVASIELYENYFILNYSNKKIKVNKGDLIIKITSPSSYLYVVYKLKLPNEKINFVNSIKEQRENKNIETEPSLNIAIEKLMFYRKLEKGEKDNNIVKFYDMKIITGLTTPEIFENSLYYVDYKSILKIPELPIVTCLIRERENLFHVVGDLHIDIRFLNSEGISENTLKKQPVISIIELDEQISLD